ncbi:MAG: hypothetical protein ACE5HP_01405 [Gemmatimonadota bacterium]
MFQTVEGTPPTLFPAADSARAARSVEVRRTVAVAGVLGSLACGGVAGFAHAQEPPPSPAAGSSLDASRIATGAFRYVMLLQGRKFGEFGLTVTRREDGSFQVSEEAAGAAGRQRSTYLFTRDLRPVSADQEGTFGEVSASLHLTYEGPWVRGRARLPAEEDPPTDSPRVREVVVDTLLAPGTLDEQMELAVILAGPLRPGARIERPIFSPGRGVRRLRAAVTDEVTVKVPAGTFETYRVEISSAESGLVVYVTRDLPRRLVKEELGGGAVSIELESGG